MRPLFKFCWLWIFPWIKLSWHSCCVWDKLGWLNWFWQFLCKGLFSFNPKVFYYSYAGLLVYVKEGLPFAQDFSLENSADSYLCFWLTLLHSVSCFFFLYWSPSSLYMVFDSNSSNIDEVFLINPSAIVFVFGDFDVHHKDWLTCSKVAFPPLWHSEHVVVSFSFDFPSNSQQDAPFYCIA